MAERPIFAPTKAGPVLVREIFVPFKWHSGMAPVQKKRNIAALHAAAAERGLGPVLEISSKSEHELGRRLSAFSLHIQLNDLAIPIENAFQGSKVFQGGGPYTDLYMATSREAKRDPRLKNSGKLVTFRFEGRDYPLSPPTAFYDWLYVLALYPHREWMQFLDDCNGFSDIEFNPQRSLNCQARSCATFMALSARGLLDQACKSFDTFRALLQTSGI
jgi:hypothetical protein